MTALHWAFPASGPQRNRPPVATKAREFTPLDDCGSGKERSKSPLLPEGSSPFHIKEDVNFRCSLGLMGEGEEDKKGCV